MAVNGIAVAGVSLGAIAVYAGVTGKSILPRYVNGHMVSPGIIEQILKGGKPSGVPDTTPITGSAGIVAAGGVTPSSAAIASDAMQYQGHPYLFGGAPGIDGTNPWDCSSFVNWVLGHDLDIVLPGGVRNYDGTTHGPTTLSYLLWSGAQTISRKNAQAGDLAVSATHMGIFISNSQYISAHDPAERTSVTPVGNFIISGEPLVCRRVTAGIPGNNTTESGIGGGIGEE